MQLLFPILIGGIIILEGLGFPYAHEAAYFTVLLIPILIYLYSLKTTPLQNKGVTLSSRFYLLSSIFYILSVFSMFFSSNKIQSLQQLLLYLSCGLVFYFSSRYQFFLQKPIKLMLYVLAIFFSLYSLLLLTTNYFRLTTPLTPLSSLNLVFPRMMGHNQLGDFLVAPLALSFVSGNYVLFFFLFLFLMVSASRSAYLALAVCIIGITILKKSRWVFPIIMVLLLMVSAIVVTTKPLQTFLREKQPLYNQFVELANIPYKSVLSGREEYVKLTLQTLKEFPLFGVGPGNFSNASTRYGTEPFQFVETSHAIFLDFFAENGLPAGIAFVVLIGYLFAKADKKNPFFWVLIALFMNFQTNYLFKFHSILLLTSVLFGLVYAENNQRSLPAGTVGRPTVVYLSFFLLLMSNILLSSKLIITHNSPLSGFMFQPLLIPITHFLFSGDASTLKKIGDNYLLLGEDKKALEAYKQAYTWHAFEGITLYKDTYQLINEIEGNRSGELFLKEHFKKIKRITMPWFPSSLVIQDARTYCSMLYKLDKCTNLY